MLRAPFAAKTTEQSRSRSGEHAWAQAHRDRRGPRAAHRARDVPEGPKDRTIFARRHVIPDGRPQIPTASSSEPAQRRAQRDLKAAEGGRIPCSSSTRSHTIVGAGKARRLHRRGQLHKPHAGARRAALHRARPRWTSIARTWRRTPRWTRRFQPGAGGRPQRRGHDLYPAPPALPTSRFERHHTMSALPRTPRGSGRRASRPLPCRTASCRPQGHRPAGRGCASIRTRWTPSPGRAALRSRPRVTRLQIEETRASRRRKTRLQDCAPLRPARKRLARPEIAGRRHDPAAPAVRKKGAR
jgi:hypothetical protein